MTAVTSRGESGSYECSSQHRGTLMTRTFAAAFTVMILTAPAANAASMVETALKLQAAKAALQKLPKAQQAMIWAKIKKKQACSPRFIRGADGKCHPLFH